MKILYKPYAAEVLPNHRVKLLGELGLAYDWHQISLGGFN